jgi:PPOX class probable F420-dependent enzyme
MKLNSPDSLDRLRSHDHAVLSTLHPDRGPDVIPVVYAISTDNLLGIPIDEVKPKTSTRLQRQRNLEGDPRAALIAQQWDKHDWGQLWWVRADLEWISDPERNKVSELSELLATRYEQYKDQPFSDVLVFRIANITGWSAS